jgi:hypothetical protein
VKSCDHCKHAEWKRTQAGRLHPSKTGQCAKAKTWVAPQIPACSYWLGGAPKPSGYFIERGRDLDTHCAYWEHT